MSSTPPPVSTRFNDDASVSVANTTRFGCRASACEFGGSLCGRARRALVRHCPGRADRLGHLSGAGPRHADDQRRAQHVDPGRGALPMFVLMVVYVLPRYGLAPFRSRSIWLLALVVVVRATTNLLSARFTLSIYVQLIALLTPFIVVLLSRAVFHERIPRYTGRAIFFSSLGALLMMNSTVSVAGIRFDFTPQDWLGISLALGSSFSLAIYMLVIRRTATATKAIPGDVVLIFQSVVIMFTAFLISLLIGEDWSRWGELGRAIGLVVLADIVLVIFGANRTADRRAAPPGCADRLHAHALAADQCVDCRQPVVGRAAPVGVAGSRRAAVMVTISGYLWRQRKPRPRSSSAAH